MDASEDDSSSQSQSVTAIGSVDIPKDFLEGGSEHRKAIIANTSLIIVLLSATELKPVLLGITVSASVLWLLVGLSHVYFFIMWRLTAPITTDSEKRFWNFSGLCRQAFLSGTKGFPGKTKAQIFFIRSFPIWAFLVGLFSVIFSLYKCLNT